MNALHFVEIEDGADVWMVQRGGKARFAFKSFEVCLFRAELRRYYLDDDWATQLDVNRFVDRSLPAHAELLRDVIVAKRFTQHQSSNVAINSAAVAVAVPTFPTTMPAAWLAR